MNFGEIIFELFSLKLGKSYNKTSKTGCLLMALTSLIVTILVILFASSSFHHFSYYHEESEVNEAVGDANRWFQSKL